MDLQDPIEIGIQMYEKCISEEIDCVIGVRAKRKGESVFKLLTAKIYYKLLSYIVNDISLKDFSSGDFYCINEKFKDALISDLPSRLYLRGKIQTLGFRKSIFLYVRETRKLGFTKFTLSKMLSFALSGVLSISNKPLRLIAYIGSIGFVGSILVALLITLVRVVNGTPTPGWSFIVVSIYLTTSIILLSLAVIAEYISMLIDGQKSRSRYFIQDIY